MDTKIAIVSIIVEDSESSAPTNDLLHEFSNYIVGRMGIPYRQRGIGIISVVVDAPQNVISSLSGKLGMIKGINVKVTVSKTGEK
ncbi:TM1266 family iron-only hydrogenase system putative regulator [Proteocatella sphenisci]|uniref:TM1266 family iron-only hydrogenase system putative regulator n=1 Tax=Proteocatella sphenisci TaxID=181070 RepID=UPI00048E05B1|nr:TM1266 family iron-only hydrogenase system putative regulator [Proteocatella sphenisci]